LIVILEPLVFWELSRLPKRPKALGLEAELSTVLLQGLILILKKLGFRTLGRLLGATEMKALLASLLNSVYNIIKNQTQQCTDGAFIGQRQAPYDSSHQPRVLAAFSWFTIPVLYQTLLQQSDCFFTNSFLLTVASCWSLI